MKKTLLIASILALILAVAGGWFLAGFLKSSLEPGEQVNVAYSPFESTALFWVAEDQHFFEMNGLNLTLREYDSGAGSLEGVVKGDADIAVGVSEFPLVKAAFENKRVRALGIIDKGEFTYLVARKDRGIITVPDLKGKRVGTTIGTVAEFHLGRFLALHGMNMKDITLVDIRSPAGWVNEVADGNIDAISTAQPYADAARDRLDGNAVTWSVQSRQPLFALVVSNDTWLKEHPETARRFLQALAEAEEYTRAHPPEAKAIIQRRLGLDPGYIDTVWRQNQFALTLDQSLVAAMEDEARWMIQNNLTNAKKVPDFRNYLYTEGLDLVKPGSVYIIG